MTPTIPVLCYHGVGPACGHDPALFEAHLDAVQALGFRTVTARELMDVCRGRRAPGRGEILLTFDDGHVTNWLYAAPALARRGMTGVFFPVTDFIGQGTPRTPDTAPPALPPRQGFLAALAGDPSHFMNEAELRGLAAMGMEVHSHSCRHQLCFRSLEPKGRLWENSHWGCAGIYPRPDPAFQEFEYASAYAYNGFWPRFAPEDADRRTPLFRLRTDAERRAFCLEDFRRSLERVQALNGAQEQYFCWPWGHFDPLAETALKEAGYAGAFTLERGPNRPGTDPFRVCRIGVADGKGPDWLRSRLRLYAWPPAAAVLTKRFRKKPEVQSVLYVTNSRLLSGGSRQMVNNAAAMAAMGLRVAVAVPPASEIVAGLAGLDVEVLPFDRFDSLGRTAAFLRAVVAERGLDVVHTFHSKAMKAALVARLTGPRFRLFINRGVIYTPNPLFFLWAAIADGVVCNSRVCAEVLRRHLVRPARLNVVYNSFVPEPGSGPGQGSDPARPAGGLPEILYVGNMAEVKGFDVFLAAAARFRELFGPGLARFAALGIEDISRYAGRVPSEVLAEVDSPGRRPHAEVLARLARADVLALTSRQESMPNVLAEGFHAGLPVVATAVGGIPELVSPGLNGLLRPSGDADGLARDLHRLALDPDLRARMGRLNRRVVAELLDNRIKGERLLSVYFGRRRDEPLDIAGLAADVR